MFDWFKRSKKTTKGKPPPKGRKGFPIPLPKFKLPGQKPLARGAGRLDRPNRPTPHPPRLDEAPGMSLDRKLDIIGIVLFFVGLGSGLSLFTADSSPWIAAWLNLLTQLAGWGKFGLPLAFMAVGLWLVLRQFGDKLPKVEPERLVGLLMLYVAFLVSLHFIATPTDDQIFEMVKRGSGGGLIGAFILAALFQAVGALGSAVLLGAWWIIAIVFTAGLSVPELVMLIQDRIRQWRGLPAAGENVQLPLPQPKAQAAKATPAPTSSKSASPEVPPSSAKPALDKNTVVPAPIILGNEQAQVWVLPEVAEMLDPGTEGSSDDEADRLRVKVIEGTLNSFGAPVRVVEINRGPTITQFGVEPDFVEQRGGKKTKVKVGKIASLADDLALALSAHSIRIQAPVPGKGYVGIEVPNVETALVALRDVMEAESFHKLKGNLRLGLGQDVSGLAIATDLSAMPHLLIAGTTGSGKSVCVNAIITCLLLQNTPDDLRFVMVDPKRVELTSYNGIPHLLAPVVVELERVVASLQWVTREMDERYRKFAKVGVRNISDYNARIANSGEKKIPYLVVIIDELADLMMLAPDETERTITRLAQLARATGIHLIIATQRPSVDVVTGLIKANFPARIAFAVASSVDSRVILDQPGAERLLGRGDMLFQSPDSASPLRMQGVFLSDKEILRVVRYWRAARGLSEDETEAATAPVSPAGETPLASPEAVAPKLPTKQKPLFNPTQLEDITVPAEDTDDMLEEAIAAVREMKRASISMLQRRLRIGYTRAARLIDILEEKGIIGPAESGAKPREVIDFGAGAEVTGPKAEDGGPKAREAEGKP